jgi:hypothetical protein
LQNQNFIKLKKYIFLLLALMPLFSKAQVQVVREISKGTPVFSIVDGATTADVCCDMADDAAVRITKPRLLHEKSGLGKQVVLVGTIGKSRFIDELVASGKLDVASIRGGWERYRIKTVDKPFPGVEQALVIAGSDRRGTAYGIFSVSEVLGVSPWYWWADVPVLKSKTLGIKPVDFTSKSPSVKYRGIFINDEDWGLKPWSSNNFEKELGDIGPKTYGKICELLLRLKANMFAPAMHTCTGAFYSHPESKVVADAYGILVTTSHCEPLLFNNAAKSEWDTKVDGDWNYGTNKNRILEKLDRRVQEASAFENIYTVGLRGLHDEGMRGNFTREEKVRIVDSAMADERSILEKHLQKPKTSIQQIYVPYKEALDVYNDGLKVPEDVTLVWVDDNYGYVKRLSDPAEQKRSGGAGVYYHTSYLGAPHDYLWLNTTPPVLMYEELRKAYDTGANRYWLVNIGDIKPAELGMQTFFDLAWNVEGFDYSSINRHQSQFLARAFGAGFEGAFQDILDTYYRLAWSRKPEFMGWEREWDAPKYRDIANTEYSFQNYNDAQQRLADYQRISDLTKRISGELPESARPAFFELMAYPVQASYQMNRKFLMAQFSRELKEAAAANWAAKQSKIAFDSINSLTRWYNSMLDGKWKGMMALGPGWTAKHQNMPKVDIQEGAASSPVDLKPLKSRNKLVGCTVIDLRRIQNKVSTQGHTLRILEGIGYDWCSIQLGEATQPTADPGKLDGTRYEYAFSGVDSDSVTVYAYSLPFFAIYGGKSTRFGLSVDGQPVAIAQNDHKEFTEPWKDRVLRNGALSVAKFAVDKSLKKHILTLTCGDPGMIIQRIVIDWGGLKKTYVGPAVEMPKK